MMVGVRDLVCTGYLFGCRLGWISCPDSAIDPPDLQTVFREHSVDAGQSIYRVVEYLTSFARGFMCVRA